MLKKSILTSHNSIIHSTINTSSSQRRQCPRHHFHTSLPPHSMTSQGHSKNSHNPNLPWPEVTSANSIPTPYQIFNQKKGSPYSKRRFYELVKLYHPDRHSHESSTSSKNDIPYATKLERYRLVVAANDILSDPIKRGAYDIYGAGWNGQISTDSASPHGSWASSSNGRSREYDPQGPWQNATWEDWEAWRNPSVKKQEPLWVPNAVFVAFIILFATLGGIGQATRVDDFSKKYLTERDRQHDKTSKDLMKARQEAREARGGYGGRDEKVWKFLRLRNEGLIGTEEEFRKLLVQVDDTPRGNTRNNDVNGSSYDRND